jgi:hypothetical protein
MTSPRSAHGGRASRRLLGTRLRARMRASLPVLTALPLWTTSEHAVRTRADSCFALAEQSSSEAGLAQLVVVHLASL